MKLLERDSNITQLNFLLDRVAGGTGQVAVVTGPAGAGKTTLMSAFAEEARARGVPVVFTALSPFRQGLHQEAGLGPDPGDEPRVLCVDDIHHADPEALSLITRLAVEAGTRPLLMLLTMRPTRPTHEEVLAELNGLAHSRLLRLHPLTPYAIRQLAEESFGLSLSDAALAEAGTLSGGNTGLLKAILMDYQQSLERLTGTPGPAAGLPVGPTYRSTVLDHYFRLDTELRRAAQGIAILGEFSTPRSAAQVAGTTVEVIDQTLQVLNSAGLMENNRFRHRVIEEAVISTIPSAQASALRIRAASALRGMGAPALEVARRLIAADDEHVPWSDSLLHETVIQAMACNDRHLAVSALQLALRSTSEPGRRAAILTKTALVLTAYDPELSCQYFHEAGALVPMVDLWVHHPTALADQMIRRGHADEALEMLAAARRRSARGERAEHPEFTTAQLLVLGEYPALLGSAGASDLPPESEASGGELPDPAAALLRVLTSGRADPETVAAASDALYSTPFNDDTAPSLCAALAALLYCGERPLLRGFLDRLLTEAEWQRAPMLQARLLSIRAALALAEGSHYAARQAAEAALALGSPQALGTRIGGPLAALTLSTIATGDLDRARKCLDQPVPPKLFESRHGLPYLYARGHLSLVDGRSDAALTDFLASGRLMSAWGIDHESILPWRLAAAGALLTRGRQEDAVQLIDQRLDRLLVRDQETEGEGASNVIDSVEQHNSAREHVFAVLTEAAQEGQMFEAVRKLTMPGPLPPVEASAARYRIEDRFSHYLNKLTHSERKVAMLAATGSSNRKIARSLSVTISTVEQHLTRTYKKLGVTGRRELRAKLG
ncbi:AAA family ATPase [Streptomyces triticirhizae]|uniref:Helix-turn-helix transcriptional regulator n=1 Tax=Streptomyces triticirhizae TaxID=2483353 RepID=A0A3M2L2P6_9ACTN|nr:LuxR family transcriptional regulator [Streptomyces triticirhizae]RMI31989.1 helix-turn-helix transcriptional regulator [Streptomyces triticirhizae]